MPSFITIDPDEISRKIAHTVAFTATLKDPTVQPQIPMAPYTPAPPPPPMTARSRGQPLFSRGNVLDFGGQQGGMVRRLKTRISSWKLLSLRSKTQANLALNQPDDDHTDSDEDKPSRRLRGLGHTCTVADLGSLSRHPLHCNPILFGDEIDQQDTVLVHEQQQHQQPPPPPPHLTEVDPFVEEAILETSQDSVLRLTPDLLGSSTPRRRRSTRSGGRDSVGLRRGSLSKVEKRSSLNKHESGLNRALLAQLRSSSDLAPLVALQIPRRRSSIASSAGAGAPPVLRSRSSSALAATPLNQASNRRSPLEEATPGHEKRGGSDPRVSYRSSSSYSSRRSATVQDVSRLCGHSPPGQQAGLQLSPVKNPHRTHRKGRSQETRRPICGSPVGSESSSDSWREYTSEARHASPVKAKATVMKFQYVNLKPRTVPISPSAPLLSTTQRHDLVETLYKCLPVHDGKKHPSPTKLQWEDMRDQWQVKAHMLGMCI